MRGRWLREACSTTIILKATVASSMTVGCFPRPQTLSEKLIAPLFHFSEQSTVADTSQVRKHQRGSYIVVGGITVFVQEARIGMAVHERFPFHGTIRRWLSRQEGNALGGEKTIFT